MNPNSARIACFRVRGRAILAIPYRNNAENARFSAYLFGPDSLPQCILMVSNSTLPSGAIPPPPCLTVWLYSTIRGSTKGRPGPGQSGRASIQPH
jgi:hypothetical protein